jgi:hypothetical protein
MQSAAHPSPPRPFASSHSSEPANRPSPHAAASQGIPGVRQRQPTSTRHEREQPSASVRLPSSQVSPTLTAAFPQRSRSKHGEPGVAHSQSTSVEAQSAAHPSPPTVLPSSHASTPATRPSPQAAAAQGRPSSGQAHPVSSWHRASQPSPASRLPSSHASPRLRAELPQRNAIEHASPATGHS